MCQLENDVTIFRGVLEQGAWEPLLRDFLIEAMLREEQEINVKLTN